MKIITCLLILAIDHGPAGPFLHGNDVLVSVLVSLSDSQILSLFLNYFFLSSLSLFLLSFTFRDHALSWHGEEKSN